MTYKPYGTKKEVPSRKTRKSTRRTIFVYNKTAKKLLRKKLRLERNALLEEV
jgi:hypothetical protein